MIEKCNAKQVKKEQKVTPLLCSSLLLHGIPSRADIVRPTPTGPFGATTEVGIKNRERDQALSESCEPQPTQKVLHISLADEHRFSPRRR
jgi:hypothetical protein